MIPSLVINQLHYHQGSQPLLQNINFAVNPGELVVKVPYFNVSAVSLRQKVVIFLYLNALSIVIVINNERNT